ncbi:GNAT family N-acetyltransferase [Shewanella salipaludis]|uniref:GNAT family N-acetyltransferase n=1 Tax=Shewanella salipaludis TaxID=2723052 RepID=A0A972FUH4_9GAMM|nr:GNAT family N-acetyltransferase [Shewanella salipaludis]NMH65996.1 GNAT family N-acetyltransferase [Shewanella salipaludis]
MFHIRLARAEDADTLARLERQYLKDELTAGSGEGFQGQAFSRAELGELIQNHWLLVAELAGEIVAYVIAGRWQFFETWPIYRALLQRLPRLTADDPALGGKHGLSRNNTCQYGPVWIKKECRGQGIFEALLARLRQEVAPSFPYMLTFIAEDNQLSYAAHAGKGKMRVLDYFGFAGRDYYLLLSESS